MFQHSRLNSDQNLFQKIKNLDFILLISITILSMISFFDTIIIENIKNFSNESINEQLRFINLIDVLYDNNINLVLSSAVIISEIDSAFHLKEKFKRTQSRLEEMKSRKYRDAS